MRRLALRFTGLAYLAVVLIGPLSLVFWRTFEHGFDQAWAAVTSPAALHAFKLTLLITAIAVPANTIFGIVAALAIVREPFRGKGIVNAVVDLPLALSPVVVGLAIFLLYGRGWLVRRPPLRRPLRPAVDDPRDDLRLAAVRRARGRARAARDRHRAGAGGDDARRLDRGRCSGASRCPSIRWAVAYGVVLTTARSLGEYGAVAVVSGRLAGETETATLHVDERFQAFDLVGAYASSVVLALLAIGVLAGMSFLRPKEGVA